MKTLNKENQHEIGFDIECLRSDTKYIAKDANLPDENEGIWVEFWEEPFPLKATWEGHPGQPILPDNNPKNFYGSWTESLFKIERK